MTISVTQQHIDHGVQGSACNCPIANAITEALDLSHYIYAVVTGEQLRLVARFARVTQYYLPKEAREFIKHYDNNQPVTPFTFELELN